MSDIDGEREVCSSAEVYVKGVVVIERRNRLDVSRIPEEIYRKHIFHHNPILSSYFGGEDLFRKARNTPGNQWSGKYRARLNIHDVRSLLTVSREAAVIFLKKSITRNRLAGQGLFPVCPIDTGVIIAYYYKSLVYSELGRQK